MRPYGATLYDRPNGNVLDGPRNMGNQRELLAFLMRWDRCYHEIYPQLRAVMIKHTGALARIRYWDFSKCAGIPDCKGTHLCTATTDTSAPAAG